jgi:effector-binding domain-containing protein
MTTQAITIPTLPLINVPATLVLGFSTTATMAIMDTFSNVPEQLYHEAARLGLTISGPILYGYDGADEDTTKEFGLTIALPVREAEPGTLREGFSYQTIPAFRATSYTYTGPWDTLMEVYDALFRAFYQQGHAYSGHVREVYTVVDFEQPDRCVTDILIGIVNGEM